METAKQKAEKFFKIYENANIAGDFATINGLYQESFMFGLPQGTKTVLASDLTKIGEKRREEFAAKGLTATRLKKVEAGAIDAHYMWATVDFDMQVNGKNKVITATYILFDDGKDLKIVMQIDHQNLAEELNTNF
jgi:hypothetical protein